MGSCTSKPIDNEKTRVDVSGRQKQQKRLLVNPSQEISESKSKAKVQPGSTGHRLGGGEGAATQESSDTSAKEAMAKAAQDRFLRQQKHLEESNKKLDNYKKTSRAEKNLASK
ncbi:uncharacterized protein KQ657_001257 [Scheffersomyces spartinae]|uniref:Uncharacterized protein n=1 Tax=Scheffersomyces spartinae TaxID=45513 RepID=A0A9P7V7S9_9ASCO|nr:uncharacterized protein KQ657_001257 [Scheffersomyces spartinae]KAG7192802.1 hypothetical protein KQ657_001257 [Scheffersomyces spartinae]